MFSDQELVQLNKRGLIPGPKETEAAFAKRVETCLELSCQPLSFFQKHSQLPPFRLEKPVAYYDWEWPSLHLRRLYDISPDWVMAYYENKGLNFLQGAQTWILEDSSNTRLPLVQFRTSLRKGFYLRMYSRDEILAHEAVHAARSCFDEPLSEEILAYATSKSFLRKHFGALVREPKEAIIFLLLLFSALLFQVISLWADSLFFEYCFKIFLAFLCSYIGAGLFRLALAKLYLKRTLQNLEKLFKDERIARAVLFRLTDGEIRQFSKKPFKQLLDIARDLKNKSLRWKMLWVCYFQKLYC